ncbi:MAG: iron ABC transporter permease [Acidobacteria bacterium]|nr:iron ABC transporter permease [Acidobacteriota bacterium]
MAVGLSKLAIGRIGRVNYARPPAAVWLSATLVAIAVLLPLAYLALRASGAGSELWSLLFRTRTFEILGRTVVLVIAVTGISLAISLPLAWLTQRTDLPLRRIWSVLTVLPLVIPSYVVGFVVVAALGPRGILQQALAGPFGLERLPDIYGFPGALLAVTLVAYPYILLPLQASIRVLDPRLEEVARSLGHGRWATFRRVVLPQLRPAMAAGALLVALYTLRDFGAVSLLRYETFTWAIYLQYQTSFDRILAAGLSLVLVVIAVVILFLEFRTRGKSQYHRAAASVSRSPTYVKLGRWRWPALGFCALVVLTALVMPVSILSYWLVRGFSAGEVLWQTTGYALNSAYVSGLAAAVTAMAAISIAILDVRYPSLFSRLLERVTYIGFALPGIVIALALVFFGANYATPIYQTLVLLVFAYAVLFLPQAVGSIRSSLLQVSPRLEEAARSLGRTPLQTLAAVTLPLVRPGILAGAGLVFLTTMKELPATLLLSPIGFKTLATSIWSATSEGLFARAAFPAILLILLSSVPMAFLIIREKRRSDK